MNKVLFVDDNKLLLSTVQKYFLLSSNLFEIHIASKGQEAIQLLKTIKIDLVITDLKMPAMDGFELIAFINTNFPGIPIIILTAYRTTNIIDKAKAMKTLDILEKPISLKKLAKIIIKNLNQDNRNGFIEGISLPNLLQFIKMEHDTCFLEIRTHNNGVGILHYKKGKIISALFNNFDIDEIVYKLLSNKKGKIRIRNLQNQFNKVTKPLKTFLQDEMRIFDKIKDPHQKNQNINTKQFKKREKNPGLEQILSKIRNIDGFQAVGVFSPNRGLVAEVNNSGLPLKKLRVLVKYILLKAQKETEIMNINRGSIIHIKVHKAHFLFRCLNELTDLETAIKDRIHLHMVLILDKGVNIAISKRKLESIIAEITI